MTDEVEFAISLDSRSFDGCLEGACWCCGRRRLVVAWKGDPRLYQECDVSTPRIAPPCPLQTAKQCPGMNHPDCPHFADFLLKDCEYGMVERSTLVSIRHLLLKRGWDFEYWP